MRRAVTVVSRFLRNVEQGYKSNPYHNATHAADVLQTLHVVLHSSGMVGTYADPLTLLACYLAAVSGFVGCRVKVYLACVLITFSALIRCVLTFADYS